MRSTLLPSLALTLLLGACAPPAASTGASPRALPAATMSTRAPMDLGAGTSRPTPVNMTIEVVVDSLGQPDLATLRVTGTGATEHRAAIQRWIESSRFRPAERDGRPVTGLFRTRIESRVEVRRM